MLQRGVVSKVDLGRDTVGEDYQPIADPGETSHVLIYQEEAEASLPQPNNSRPAGSRPKAPTAR